MSKFILLALFLLYLAVCVFSSTTSDRVLIKDVTTLTLAANQQTTGRRSSPVPQLQCIGGSAGCYNTPSSVRCKQDGWDGDAQWSCEAVLADGVRFGSTTVTCEGYDYPDDPYILKGSCGLEYTLESSTPKYDYGNYNYGSYDHSNKSWGESIFTFIVVALIIYGLYIVCFQAPQAAGNINGRPGGYGGNYGPGGPPGGGGGGGFGPGYGPSCYAAPPPVAYPTGGGGFWNGLLTGGLLGYALNGRRGYGGYGGYGAYGGGYGGGYGGRGFGGGYGGGGFGGGRSFGGGPSTGFAGTRRR